MNRPFRLLAAFLFLLMSAGSAFAQATQPVTEPDPLQAINHLRTELVEAFNKGDVDRLLSHLDPDVVVTWQNGEICRGPAAVKAYYDKMMAGPNHIVAKLSADPKVEDRHIYGDWAVSWGNLHDEYELNDGSKFKLDSHFTSTIARRGTEWKVTSFHASVNAFDNPILAMAEKKTGTYAGVGGGVIGLIVGVIIGIVVGRRKKPSRERA